MKQGQDIKISFPGSCIIHQKIRGNTVGSHDHDEHELFIPLQGEIHILAGATDLRAGPGKMIYLPPHFSHSFQASNTAQGERLIFLVAQKTWRAFEGGHFGPTVVSVSQLCKELLFHLLIHPKTKAAKSLTATLVQTVSEMLEMSGVQFDGELVHLSGRAQDVRVKVALEEISSHFNLPLPMEDLAKKSGMSLRNFNRLFLTELGLSPKQAVTLYRIKAAQKLLREKKDSVTDIALEVGYQSLSQFISTYRKVTGHLPSEESI